MSYEQHSFKSPALQPRPRQELDESTADAVPPAAPPPARQAGAKLPSSQQSLPIIYRMIEELAPQIQAALPRLGMTAARMIRIVRTCLRTTPRLAECEQHSIIAAVLQLAQLGLEPATPLGHAWILPYNRRAQVRIGYRGYIALADRAGITLGADVVRERDHFSYPCPGDTRIEHIPYEGADGRGARRCAYAYALRCGRWPQFRVIGSEDIERARQASPAVQQRRMDSPWFGDERGAPADTDAMWRKTAILRLVPFLPMATEHQYRMVRAMELDAQEEQGITQVFDYDTPEARTAAAADSLEAGLQQVARATEQPQQTENEDEYLGEEHGSTR